MMKSLLTILLALVGCLGLFSACSDSDAPFVNDIVVCDYDKIDTTAICLGQTVFDTELNHMTIHLDSSSLTPSWLKRIPEYSGYILHPLHKESFNIDENKSISFRITKFGYIDTGDSAVLYARVADIIELEK